MTTQRTLRFGTLTILCLTLATTGWAQKKKSGGGGDAIMAEAARAVQLAQEGATDEAIKIFTKVIERGRRMRDSTSIVAAFI